MVSSSLNSKPEILAGDRADARRRCDPDGAGGDAAGHQAGDPGEGDPPAAGGGARRPVRTHHRAGAQAGQRAEEGAAGGAGGARPRARGGQGGVIYFII
eukprot:CAMPEP_0182853032 /NCGR_PEP_ID=MMETSP0034_2-20130328/482_1 /TAXON_ID=156128 /ORGANISM="Nephroselmis pyriformis, Strain CCMP717" /LENGTH=98 /DNA_ID=CAMNT_0024983779 /DNA_START=374 /DNA_END=670 /DNA_ORIENTATION=-